MFAETFHKYIIVVALFAVFLLLANVWSLQRRKSRRARPLRRRRRRTAARADEAPAEIEPIEPEGTFQRYLPWISAAALLVCIAALALMWYAATLAAVRG